MRPAVASLPPHQGKTLSLFFNSRVAMIHETILLMGVDLESLVLIAEL